MKEISPLSQMPTAKTNARRYYDPAAPTIERARRPDESKNDASTSRTAHQLNMWESFEHLGHLDNEMLRRYCSPPAVPSETSGMCVKMLWLEKRHVEVSMETRASVSRLALIAVVLGSLLSLPPTCSAQSTRPNDIRSLRAEVESLKLAHQAVLQEMHLLRAAIERLTSPTPAVSAPASSRTTYLEASDGRSKGSPDAPLILVEFSDYHCPFCGEYFRNTYSLIDTKYVATGLVRYVFRDYPVFSVLPNMMAPAEAAHCAGEQGQFWPMHDAIFNNQRALTRDSLISYGRAIGVDLTALATCLKERRNADIVKRGLRDGSAAGVRGTPTFFIAVAEPDHTRLRVLRVIHGAQSYAYMEHAIDELLQNLATHR